MAAFKRIFLFMVVNLLVIVTITIVTTLLGVPGYMSAQGLNYTTLLVFCVAWGMGGAFISLALSRMMAKWMLGVQVIDANVGDAALRDLVARVHRLARAAGIDRMPEVGIYQSAEVNAFATGPTKNRSLVAVSSGLLGSMSSDQVDGVLGHEIAHVANGDMVTMTLVQGIVNAFVMFFALVVAFFVSTMVREQLAWIVRFVVTIALEIAFSFLGMLVVAAFSRWREYRADAGGARLAGREKMIGALRALQGLSNRIDPNAAPALQSLKISSKPAGLMALFATHPPLAERIRRLERSHT